MGAEKAKQHHRHVADVQKSGGRENLSLPYDTSTYTGYGTTFTTCRLQNACRMQRPWQNIANTRILIAYTHSFPKSAYILNQNKSVCYVRPSNGLIAVSDSRSFWIIRQWRPLVATLGSTDRPNGPQIRRSGNLIKNVSLNRSTFCDDYYWTSSSRNNYRKLSAVSLIG